MLHITVACTAQTRIWYPGDYEIWLGNKMNNRRTERGAFFPPFWKIDSHYIVVEFSKQIDLKEAEDIFIMAEGKYNLKLDGKLQFGMPQNFKLPAGKHSLNIKVWNQVTPPAIYVKGKSVNSDSSWNVTFEDKEWIDESGKTSGVSATVYMKAGSWNFNEAAMRPSEFALACETHLPALSTVCDKGILYDFGKETFGYLTLKQLKGKGYVYVYYGESSEEALDKAFCETLDKVYVEDGKATDISMNETREIYTDYTFDNSKAFRYVYIVAEDGVDMDGISMEYEYLPRNTEARSSVMMRR
jgi:hypothetical protein